ncbi:MAG: hypothetical protein ACRD8A_12785 [Candidatus Acidiferrales bacterium]
MPKQRPYTEKEMLDIMLPVMKRANIPPELVYAFEKTGPLLTTETYPTVTPEERKEWDDAIAEYFRLNGADPAGT